MKIEFRPVVANLEVDCRLMAQWNNDLSLRPLVRPCRGPEQALERDTPGMVKERLLKKSPWQPQVQLMILADGKPVGTADLLENPPHRLTREHPTAWFGISIGEEWARHCGVGSATLAHLEEIARSRGLTYAEVGVFEFNAASLAFFAKHGYRELGRVPEFTWWDGRRWADVRMRKGLTNRPGGVRV